MKRELQVRSIPSVGNRVIVEQTKFLTVADCNSTQVFSGSSEQQYVSVSNNRLGHGVSTC